MNVTDNINDSYILDTTDLVSDQICVALDHAPNIVPGGSPIVVTPAPASTVQFHITLAFEASGLGTAPTLDSHTTGVANSISTSCKSGDIAFAFFWPASGPSSGNMTTLGTPAGNGWGEWEAVASTGTVTASVSGGGAAGPAGLWCFTPHSGVSPVQVIPYQSVNATSAVFSYDSQSGDVIFPGMGWCNNAGCTAATCGSGSFTDNAGSHGGSGNNSYVTDFSPTTSNAGCITFGHASSITATTSALTIVTSVTSSTSFRAVSAVEMQGLAHAPVFDSGALSSVTTATSVSTSCHTGDIAIGLYSGSANATGANLGLVNGGWVVLGSPADNQLYGYLQVASTGTTTFQVTTTGSGNMGISCWSLSAPTARHRLINVFLQKWNNVYALLGLPEYGGL